MSKEILFQLIPKIILNDNSESHHIITGSSLKEMSQIDKKELLIKINKIIEIIGVIISTINKDISNHFNIIQEDRKQLEKLKSSEQKEIQIKSSIKIMEIESQISDLQNKIKELYTMKTQKEENKIELLSIKTQCTSLAACLNSDEEFLKSINLTYIEEIIKVL
ncbi:hypothetical protein ACTA71_000455 [Dictyostelium dimigraforme]